MASITSLAGSDGITSGDSMAKINNNFAALNTDKIETSVIDVDTTLAADSDSKLASQKAVKAYVDAGGNVNATTTARGIVEVATQSEVDAGTATGATGASLMVTPATLDTNVTNRGLVSTFENGTATYDLTTASGTQTIAHGLGVVPKCVRVIGVISDERSVGGSSSYTSRTEATYNGTTQASVFTFHSSAENTNNFSSDGALFRVNGTSYGQYQSGVITTDATNITITWTKTSTPTGTSNLMWEAIA
jgi:hypothetical protein